MTVGGGSRASASRSYLPKIPPNLTIVKNAQVTRINSNNNKATGVDLIKLGKSMSFVAKSEVILSAGAIDTPKLLMLSGIGPRDHLTELNITPIADVPGVGANLMDHLEVYLQQACTKPVSLSKFMGPLGKARIGAQWFLNRTGVVASNHFEVVACVRSDKGVEYPDLQLTLSPIAVDDATWAPLQEHAFQIHVGLMRAHSRGEITLRDSDPKSPPRILVNYLKDPRDRDLLRTGIRIVRELVDQPAFAGLCGAEIFPGAAVQADADLDLCLNSHLATQWHLSGTARMGASTDTGAVVDPQGRVHGIAALRVVDASIMPAATNGNTNSPTLMIAEKLSDAILGVPPLSPLDVAVWQNPNYETSQR